MKLRFLAILIILISLFGFWLSFEAHKVHVFLEQGLKSTSAMCQASTESACERVAASNFSVVFGLPIAIYGELFYLLMIVVSFLALFTLQQSYFNLISVSYVAAIFFSIILFLISKFLIQALCPVCIRIYIINFLGFFACLAFLKNSLFSTENLRIFVKELQKLLNIKNFCICLIAFVFICYVPFLLKANILKDALEQRIQQLNLPWPQAIKLPQDVSIAGEDRDFYKGNPEAPIQIVEYADLQCPHCKILSKNLELVLKEFPDKYFLVYKNFPLSSSCNEMVGVPGHAHACKAAVNLRCAGLQGKFWELQQIYADLPELDYRFSAQQFEIASNKVVSDLKIDLQVFSACVSSPSTLSKISSDAEQGSQRGIGGTPYLVVNGRRLKDLNLTALRLVFKDILDHYERLSARRS